MSDYCIYNNTSIMDLENTLALVLKGVRKWQYLAKFLKSVVQKKQYPDPKDIEFAFIGRSNVGKSSLINSLVERKNLARTSKTPGRTQLINFLKLMRICILWITWIWFLLRLQVM